MKKPKSIFKTCAIWVVVVMSFVAGAALSSCQMYEEQPCDYGTEKVIYVTEYGTNEVIPGADVFLTNERPNNGVQTVYHCKTDERGMAHWPCAIDYSMLCVEAGDDYWEYCPSRRQSHYAPFLLDDIYELTTKSTIRIHVPSHYYTESYIYGYLNLSCNELIDGYTGADDYGVYADVRAMGAKENILHVTHMTAQHQLSSMYDVILCPPPFDTLEYYIPIPQ